jgi:hypothetical protein
MRKVVLGAVGEMTEAIHLTSMSDRNRSPS